MKKIITLIAALSAMGLASPAIAQDRYGNGYGNNQAYGYSNGYGGIEARTDQLQRRLQVGIQRGTISRREADYLRDGFRQLSRLERQYSRGGLDRNERQFLQQRLQQLQQEIQAAERNRGDGNWGDGRDGRDGYDNDGRDDDNWRNRGN